MSSLSIEIDELDEAGSLCATYVESAAAPAIDLADIDVVVKMGSEEKRAKAKTRVDTVLPPNPKPTWQQLLDVFLPAGYPHSVTEDYVWYQLFDSLQAFASSIAGMLSNRAVLEGVGVGDASASPTAALLLSVVQESVGRLATIAFAHRFGTSLEPECKRWRLAADMFNDAAMVLDLLSPAFPKPARVCVLAGSSVLRSLCGVAAGSAKASLSAHFAKQGNLGEVSAKDSSQETVISLVGMLAGTAVVSVVTSRLATWATLLLLLAGHLALNMAAVRAVSMRSLNRQRANIVFSHLMAWDKALTPREASARERIFERDGILRWADGVALGHCKIGVSMGLLVQSLLGGSVLHSRSTRVGCLSLAELLAIFHREDYLLWYHSPSVTVVVVLKQGCGPRSQAKAWCHGLGLARDMAEGGSTTATEQDRLLKLVVESLERTSKSFPDFARRLDAAGWNLNAAALETHSGRRAVVRTDRLVVERPK